MEKNPEYSILLQQLEQLVSQVEDENIELDTLADKVKQANELITLCQTKLRVIEDNVKSEQ